MSEKASVPPDIENEKTVKKGLTAFAKAIPPTLILNLLDLFFEDYDKAWRTNYDETLKALEVAWKDATLTYGINGVQLWFDLEDQHFNAHKTIKLSLDEFLEYLWNHNTDGRSKKIAVVLAKWERIFRTGK